MSIKKGGDRHASIKEVTRMNVNIDSTLHRKFKTATASEGREMSEVVIDFIQKYVDAHPVAARLADKGGRQ